MKSRIIAILSLVLAFFTLLPAQASAQNLADRLKGYFLLSVQDRGKIWFVDPSTGSRSHIADANVAWDLIKSQMIGISNADLAKLPTPGQAPKDKALRDRLKGKFLLAVEQHGEVWFVNPHTGYRHYLGTGTDTYNQVKTVSLGITLADLESISISSGVDTTTQQDSNETQEQPEVKKSVSQFTDANYAWEFASSLWSGYEAFYRDHGYYPEIKWLENIFQFNQTMFLTENGFTLDTDTAAQYWSWSDLRQKFHDMYNQAIDFSVNAESGRATLRVELPHEVNTPNFGNLQGGTYYFVTGLGLLNEAGYDNIDQLIEETDSSSFDLDSVKENLASLTFTDSQMLWDFSQSIWEGYAEFKKQTDYYIGIQWFENLFEYGLTAYLTKDGYTLDRPSDSEIIWLWNDYSVDFLKMYFDHFDLIIDTHGKPNMKLVLPTELEVEEHGVLQPGVYFFNEEFGLMTEEEFEEKGDPFITKTIDEVDLEEESRRIIEFMQELKTGLTQYSAFVSGAYPQIFGGVPIPLGEQGNVYLSDWGIGPNKGNRFIMKLENGAPTTHFQYDSRLGGESYVVYFDLLEGVRVRQENYVAGRYEMTPDLGIQKVADLPE